MHVQEDSLEDQTTTRNFNPGELEDQGSQLKPKTLLENRYLVERALGTGGMGAVYLARDSRFSVTKYVAVKEIIAQVTDAALREIMVANFEREANLLASISHAAIPKIHDFFSINNRSYVVMEYIRGKDLESIVNANKENLSVQQIAIWGIELCDVLHYLHTRSPEPIVFRDMKPSNIMVTPENHVVLVDFGIAKKFQAGQKGTMIGTEGYSPPEQYRGESSPKVDIYALGATLHHLLTSIDPRDEAPFTFAERPIRQLNPDVSIEFETIVETALQYNADERFKDANTMKEALIQIARQGGSSYHPKGTAAIIRDYEIKQLWDFECEDEIRGSAIVQGGLLYIGAYDNNLYALDATSGHFKWKYASEGGIAGTPAYFENSVFFGSEDHRVYAINAISGRVQWSYSTDGPIRSTPTIQDRHVFIGSDDEHIHVINTTTGRRATKINAGALVRSKPLLINDGLYFGTENGDLFFADFNGKIRWRANAKRAVTSSPSINNGVVYFGSVDGQFYAVNAQTGWPMWRFRMERGTISSPFVTDQFAYIGSADGNIYCINLQTSKEAWHFSTGHQVSSSPLLHNDAIYCGSIDNNIYCLDAKTGNLRWKFDTGGAITGSPTIANNILYIGSLNHFLYALPI
ncbi:MAG: PQQ-binding-like beta-propeller repeat protein [Chloroflexi bacterium]|nr:PQQ-binding-like beta-propeller repeat protein [Chloroflexota bacterium]